MKTALLILFSLALFASPRLPAGDRVTLTVATKGLKPSDWSSDEGVAVIVEEPVGALTRIQLMSDKTQTRSGQFADSNRFPKIIASSSLACAQTSFEIVTRSLNIYTQ